MAVITIPVENRRIEQPDQVTDYLAARGIRYERWPLEDRCHPDAAAEEILAAYAPEIERLKAEGGYVTADVINVTPDTPGLETMLAKFNKEHTHSEDEVRFIVKGRGVFHIHPPGGPVFGLQLDPGDWINVPAGTRHWFDLCNERCIRAIRLFLDKSGWAPHYVEPGVHGEFTPVCWGLAHVPPQATLASVVTP